MAGLFSIAASSRDQLFQSQKMSTVAGNRRSLATDIGLLGLAHHRQVVWISKRVGPEQSRAAEFPINCAVSRVNSGPASTSESLLKRNVLQDLRALLAVEAAQPTRSSA